MAVSREFRNAATIALVAFFRGEINFDELRTRFRAILDSAGDRLIPDEFVGDLLYEFSSFCRGPITKKRWSALRKALAYLQTDLEPLQHELPKRANRSSEEIVQARWHALVLAIAVYPAWIYGWWIFFAVSIVSCLIIRAREWRQDLPVAEAQRAICEWYRVCYPFANEEEWRLYEPVLETMGVPKSYPGRGPTPIFEFIGQAVSAVFETVGLVIIVPLMFMYVVVLPFFYWPIYLIVTSLQRRHVSNSQDRCPA